MKKYFGIVSTIILIWHSCPVSAQIVNQPVSLIVPCCSHSDSIDIGNDGVFDIRIESSYGIDNANINNIPLQNNIKVTNNPVDSGTAFISYNPMGGIIAQTSIMCFWNAMWIPNSGPKYVGFRKVNAPNDTTFGWIKLNFTGDASSCADTVHGIELAYNSLPNAHLNAGQQLISGVNEITYQNSVRIAPAITEGLIHIENNSSDKEIIKLFSSDGTFKMTVPVNGHSEINLDISNLKGGIYYFQDGNSRRSIKVVKLN